MNRLIQLTIAGLKPYGWTLALAVLLTFLTVAANVGLMGTSGYLISAAALQPESVLLLWIPIVGVRFFGIARGASRYAERLVSHDLTFRWLAELRVWLYRRIEPEAFRLLSREDSARLLSVMMQDVEQMQQLVLRVCLPVMASGLMIGWVGVLSYVIHPVASFIIVVGMILTSVFVPWISYRQAKISAAGLSAAKEDYMTTASDLMSRLSSWLVAGRVGESYSKLTEIQQTINNHQQQVHQIQTITSGLVALGGKLTAWLVLVMTIPAIAEGTLSGVWLASLLLITLAGFEAVAPLPAAYQHWQMSVQSLNRFIAMARDINTDADIQVTNMSKPMEQLSIELHRVTASFAGEDRKSLSIPALRNLTLRIRPGEKIAITGLSGAGKSALIQCLTGAMEITGGQMQFNQRPHDTWQPETLRRQFSVLTQPVHLFHHTIDANIRIAKPEATGEEIAGVINRAQLAPLIESLPLKMNTIAGENGSLFSGGERQRIGIARVLLRDAPVLILDEPLTGLDQQTAHEIVETIRQEAADKTQIWITHEFSGLETMDRIVVMHDGEIVEEGTWQTLIAIDGRLAKMAARQLALRNGMNRET